MTTKMFKEIMRYWSPQGGESVSAKWKYIGLNGRVYEVRETLANGYQGQYYTKSRGWQPVKALPQRQKMADAQEDLDKYADKHDLLIVCGR